MYSRLNLLFFVICQRAKIFHKRVSLAHGIVIFQYRILTKPESCQNVCMKKNGHIIKNPFATKLDS